MWDPRIVVQEIRRQEKIRKDLKEIRDNLKKIKSNLNLLKRPSTKLAPIKEEPKIFFEKELSSSEGSSSEESSSE